ncbi:hypothetical protein BG005_000879 [Podila minutissima]|nr:hypothetical protein BG005_000879 [Podila minutissima]
MPDYGKLLFKSLDTTPLATILRPQPVKTLTADTDGPPTLISETAFELIERMVVYSGGRRISAREALAYKDRYLEDSTNKESQECWLDVDTILDEKRRLKEKLADDDEDGGGCGYMMGGSRSPRYGHVNFSRSVEDDDEEEEVERYRSDDLYGEEEENTADYDKAPITLAVDSHEEERSPKRRR